MIQKAKQIPDWLESSLEKRVAILGGGISGRGTRALVESLGGESVIYDAAEVDGCQPKFSFEDARDSQLVVASPGFEPGHPWLKAARDAGCLVYSEFDLGAALWEGPIIAVTGTNGKTTLTSFLNHAFRHNGIESFAVGNVGRPLCELLSEHRNPEAIAVCEVSSFQAETSSHFRADYVLWTNFAEDHLDRHGTLESYYRSKYKLIANMRGSSIIVDKTVFSFGRKLGLPIPESSVQGAASDEDRLKVEGTVFASDPEIESFLMARSLWRLLGLDDLGLEKAARRFEKDPHRMEFIGEVSGIRFWDDSKATNFHATLAGVKRFDRPVIWIGGGKDKGGSIHRFAREIAPHVKQAVLIGETRFSVKRELEALGCEAYESGTIKEAVKLIFEAGQRGDDVLLSPGFASLDMFENYAERGMAFRAAIGLG